MKFLENNKVFLIIVFSMKTVIIPPTYQHAEARYTKQHFCHLFYVDLKQSLTLGE